MKYIFQLKNIRCLLLLCIVFNACKKDNYLTDGGVHNEATPLSTYDYLAAHPYQYFDTVIMIIDHFDLKDSVNNSGTFFAPTDYSIHNVMEALHITSLDSLYELTTSKFITQYLFSDKNITLDNATESTVTYENWADTIAGVKKTSQLYGSVNSTFTYYILQYIKINGYPDGSAGAPPDDPLDVILNCQTTGIKTSSGTTLHVLSNLSSLSIK